MGRLFFFFPKITQIYGGWSRDKTRPQIQNTPQNPKHFLEFKNACQNPKHVPESAWKHIPESKTLSVIQKLFPESKTRPRIQKQFRESKILPRIQNTLGFWDGFLDSGKCFLIVIMIRRKMSTIFCGHGVIASTAKSAAWYLSSIVTTRGFTHLEVIKNKMQSKTFSRTYVKID